MTTCEQAIRHFTELEEGILPFAESIRLRLHLFHCPRCRSLISECRKLPAIMQRGSRSEDAALLSMAQDALRAAQARITQFQPRRHPQASPVPLDLERILQSGADATLRIMELVHRAFVEGTAPLAAPFLPAAALSMLPPTNDWAWKPRGSARIATLLDASPGGPRLSLMVAPHGFRTPSHVHLGSEQMLVLEGLLEDGDAAYPTGSWTHFGEGSTHGPLVLNDECWCLLREEGTVHYTGPLGWFRNLWAA